MIAVRILLRLLLGFSLVIAGSGHAMPIDLQAMGMAGGSSQLHCREHRMGTARGAAASQMHASVPSTPGKSHPAAGCCKGGACPCPHPAATASGGAAPGMAVCGASDFTELRSSYRSPPAHRRIRPPIVRA